MGNRYDAAVIGAGAAGCAAALRLRLAGLSVALIEKSAKVSTRFCGEFLSGEARLALDRLGARAAAEECGPATIRCMSLSAPSGATFRMELSEGGWGVTRRALDSALLELAVARGVQVFEGVEVESIDGNCLDGFRLAGKETIRARAVIGAWGKRAALDRRLGRRFLRRPSDWIGVKAHFDGAPRRPEVGLFAFRGGHCGFVDVEGGRGTLAMLARKSALVAAGGRPLALLDFARAANPTLCARLAQARVDPASLLTVAQVPFMQKEPVALGVLLVGDAAGLTAPFLGLGVANALSSGVNAAEATLAWLGGEVTPAAAIAAYASWRRRSLRPVQIWSRPASALLSRPAICEIAVRALNVLPAPARALYRTSRTRYAPMPAENFRHGL